jgi:hypothetical protein
MGGVGALTVMTVELVTDVTVVGVVPLMLVGHGDPSSHPPPPPGGLAVGAEGSESRIATSTASLAIVVTHTNACSGTRPCTYGAIVPFTSVVGISLFLDVLPNGADVCGA